MEARGAAAAELSIAARVMTPTTRAQEYEVVYNSLVNAARSKSRVFYWELARLLASLPDDPEQAADVSAVLREVAAAEHYAGRPLLTALAVTGKSIPGNVFFTSARDLGLLTSAEPAEEMRFWMEEEHRVYETWSLSPDQPANPGNV